MLWNCGTILAMPMARLQVLLAALCFATTGTAQALGPDGTDPVGVGAVRILVGGALLVAVAFITRAGARGPRWDRRPRGERVRSRRRDGHPRRRVIRDLHDRRQAPAVRRPRPRGGDGRGLRARRARPPAGARAEHAGLAAAPRRHPP